MTQQHTAKEAFAAALLLVDDERAFVDALSMRLESRGYTCWRAYRGEEALTLLDRPDLEIVLLDLNMPGVHGLEVLQHIKTKRPDVEVILMTAEADLSMAAKGMRRGAGDYLVKPVEFETLIESIHKAHNRAQDHQERLRAAQAGRLMALGALAAGVGHEINNPLQIIFQRAEWILELMEEGEQGPLDVQEIIHSANVIRNQTKRCGEITSQLLDMAYKTKAQSLRADARETAKKVSRILAERATTLGVELHMLLAEPLPDVACSPLELEVVLIHLAQNSLDSIEALTLKEEAALTRHYVRISAEAREGEVILTVEDSGEGIAPDVLPHIFDPFFSTRQVGKGAGLGLTVCHSIVAALRGAIRYQPAQKQGAVFLVTLPALQEPALAGGQ